MTELVERISMSIARTREMLLDMRVAKIRRYAGLQDRAGDVVNRQLTAYKQYLLTLDPELVGHFMDISESGGNVYVTRPVEIGGGSDLAFSVRCENLLCFGSPDIPDARQVFAIPNGKYRFVLITIPMEDDDD